jgi:hypothetical protein
MSEVARGFRETRERRVGALLERAKVFSGALKALLPSTDRLLAVVIVERDRGMERVAVVRNNIVKGFSGTDEPRLISKPTDESR